MGRADRQQLTGKAPAAQAKWAVQYPEPAGRDQDGGSAWSDPRSSYEPPAKPSGFVGHARPLDQRTLQPNSPSCGTQPAHISLTARRPDTHASLIPASHHILRPSTKTTVGGTISGCHLTRPTSISARARRGGVPHGRRYSLSLGAWKASAFHGGEVGPARPADGEETWGCQPFRNLQTGVRTQLGHDIPAKPGRLWFRGSRAWLFYEQNNVGRGQQCRHRLGPRRVRVRTAVLTLHGEDLGHEHLVRLPRGLQAGP